MSVNNNYRPRKKSRRRRRARRLKAVFIVILMLILILGAAAVVRAVLPYEVIDLGDYFTIEYGGYNTKGTAKAVLDERAVDELMISIKEGHEKRLINLASTQPEDYVKFRSSLSANVTPSEGLSNGSNITLTCHYDEELAKKLKIDVETVTKEITVSSLIRATVISNEQLFQDVEVTFQGVSPKLTIGVVNHSEHPFIKNVIYDIIEPKDYYAQGDEVELIALFDENKAFEMQYVVDENASCTNSYIASGSASYVDNFADISQDIINEAIAAGTRAFVNANEYGVRIFCEGNLVPVYINKKATFEWLTPRALSAYFEVTLPSDAGKMGNTYNDLNIIYECHLTQANGVTCPAYCVVRFSDFIKNQDGSISYDFSNPKIMSASYYVDRVKKTVITFNASTHSIDKVY